MYGSFGEESTARTNHQDQTRRHHGTRGGQARQDHNRERNYAAEPDEMKLKKGDTVEVVIKSTEVMLKK